MCSGEVPVAVMSESIEITLISNHNYVFIIYFIYYYNEYMVIIVRYYMKFYFYLFIYFFRSPMVFYSLAFYNF